MEVTKKVLVVDDYEPIRGLVRYFAELHGLVALEASTINDGRKLFCENRQDICLIVMDGCVENDELDSVPLVEEIRALGYSGPMLAASGSSICNDRLMAAGCSHKVSSKTKLIPEIEEILGIE